LFLSKAERDYLLSVDRQKANHDYVCVKSRLHKKLKVFVDQELPLLLKNGYLSNIAEFRNVAENCNISKTLFAQADNRSDVNIMFESEPRITERGSPSLVGRGIANPMSERTRGFEILRNRTKFPLPALFSFEIFSNFVNSLVRIRNPTPYQSMLPCAAAAATNCGVVVVT
jgi:hypothetical protein